MKHKKIPLLIAHRGYSKHYPENTLIGVEAALEAGACYLEVDIQLTADGIPVLFHDEALGRTTGGQGAITDVSLNQVLSREVRKRTKGRSTLDGDSIATLSEFVVLLKNRPSVTCFIEFKKESIQKFGISAVTIPVMEILKPIQHRCVPISKNVAVLEDTRQRGARKIGLIINRYDPATLAIAQKLNPEFLFCNIKKLPPAPQRLWAGSWKWALYEVTVPEDALAWGERGADFIETMEIGEMLKHPLLKQVNEGTSSSK